MALSTARLRSIIESMLLVSAEPLPHARIIEVIQGEDRNTDEAAIKQAIRELVADYGKPDRPLGRGFRVDDVAGGLQMRSTPDNAAYLRRLLAVRPQKLTKPALETLAIIAYRQPCTKPDVEKIRGVDCGATIKALLDRELVRILGKSDEIGRPLLYGTTQQFLELFGLKSLAALPTLREYHELDDDHQKQVDELFEAEQRPAISDLAATAKFLVERTHDDELDALDEAVKAADRARQDASVALDPTAAEASPAEPVEEEP